MDKTLKLFDTRQTAVERIVSCQMNAASAKQRSVSTARKRQSAGRRRRTLPSHRTFAAVATSPESTQGVIR